ncbi:ABC transporter permease [Maribellus maritimus]|uniref:ABC transporter permease n=1 Tax=Maribellus maritimus TaxID=2870838 RepID=UPI001EE9FF90|nr:ABC transporter permease [Maribellus maritimus]MCG6187899.1 ABC transporter permease [Maribellus maritimus]
MIKNYLKITWKVLMRNKLFTFISLFGISFTLIILIVAASFFDYFTKSNYPAKKLDRISFISNVRIWDEQTGKNSYNNYIGGSPSYYLLDNYARTLETPLKVSINSNFVTSVNSYINAQKLELKIRHTDDEFWNVLDFKFIAGRPYNKNEVEDAQQVAVISESVAKTIFNESQDAIGKQVEMDKINYTIIGIVKDVPFTSQYAYGNVWVPITTTKNDLSVKKLDGGYSAILLAKKRGDLPKIESEFQAALKKIDFPFNGMNFIDCHAESVLEDFIRFSPVNKKTFSILLSAVIFILLFIPSLNLISMNTTRISERLSEIGIRKSFGATKIALTGQFLTENIVLTILGGVIAFIFSFIVLKFFQPTGIIPSEGFPLNFRIFFTGLFFCFLFGFISGVLPAYRMSRLQIVESLKGGEL